MSLQTISPVIQSWNAPDAPHIITDAFICKLIHSLQISSWILIHVFKIAEQKLELYKCSDMPLGMGVLGDMGPDWNFSTNIKWLVLSFFLPDIRCPLRMTQIDLSDPLTFPIDTSWSQNARCSILVRDTRIILVESNSCFQATLIAYQVFNPNNI